MHRPPSIVEGEVNKTQQILLQLLKELDEICRKNDITYYLVGGTALGAVRHHGFIPWDDDGDIVMDYWNYMKFVEVMKQIELPPNRDYSDPFLPPYTQLNIFGRYSSTDSTDIFDGIAFEDSANNGIKIDVFMLIPAPDDPIEREEYLTRFRRWSELAHPVARSRDTDPAEYWHYAQIERSEGMFPLRINLFNALECEKYINDKQYLYCYEARHVFYDKDIFGEPKYFPFEDTELPVPTKYQQHFRAIYGDDWMNIPDEQGQIVHMATVDTDRPYRDYTDDYMRFKPSNSFELRQDYKYQVFRYWGAQDEVNHAYGALKAAFLERKYSLFWNREEARLEQLFSEKRYEDVLVILQGYIDDQVGALAQKGGMFLKIPPRMIYLACASATFLSKTKVAKKLLLNRPETFESAEVDEIQGLLDEKDRLTFLFEEKRMNQDVERQVKELFSKFPDDRDIALWRIDFLIGKSDIASRQKEYQEALDICNRFKNDGRFLKRLGDLARARHDLSGARDYYAKAVSRTDNGMVLLEIEEMSDMDIKRPEVIYHG